MRTFHWGLVGGIAAAFATSLLLPPRWTLVHAIVGGISASLVLTRLVWGVFGPTYARFSSFVRGPRRVAAYGRELLHGTAPRHLGHNPAGAAMIVALLSGVLLVAVSGAMTLGGALRFGPLAAVMDYASGSIARELHEVVAYTLLALIGAHVLGVIFESRRTHENLARAMVLGCKESRPHDDVPSPIRSRTGIAAVVGVALIGTVAVAAVAMAAREPKGIPAASLDPTYKKECGECHIAYHPSLLPSDRWAAVMDGLARHFGENAALPAATSQAIRSYLTANAAETVDTLPANELRTANPTDPLRISATPFWTHTHHEIDPATFKAKPVRSKSNCAACHGDAETGMFQPWNIQIPVPQP